MPSESEIEQTDDLTKLDGWLAVTAAMARDAKSRGDNALLARAGSLAVALLEARRKATPDDASRDGVFVSHGQLDESQGKLDELVAKVVAAVAKRIVEGKTSPSSTASPIERAAFLATCRAGAAAADAREEASSDVASEGDSQ